MLPCPLQPAQSQFFDRLRPRSRDVTDGTAGVFVGQTASSLDRKRAASFSASPATPVGKSKRSGDQTQSVHDIDGRVVGTEDVGAAAFGSFTFAGKLLT